MDKERNKKPSEPQLEVVGEAEGLRGVDEVRPEEEAGVEVVRAVQAVRGGGGTMMTMMMTTIKAEEGLQVEEGP
jgi:hypothetical protein